MPTVSGDTDRIEIGGRTGRAHNGSGRGCVRRASVFGP